MRTSFVIAFSALTFVFNSCQKKFDPPFDAVVNTKVDFKAQISGVQFVAAIWGAVRRNDGVISIAGKTADQALISFTLADSGVHVYSLDMNSSTNFCGYEDSNGLAFSSYEGINPGDSGGALAITSIDPSRRTMSGTFSLKVFRQLDRTQRIITEGIFTNIPY